MYTHNYVGIHKNCMHDSMYLNQLNRLFRKPSQTTKNPKLSYRVDILFCKGKFNAQTFKA